MYPLSPGNPYGATRICTSEISVMLGWPRKMLGSNLSAREISHLVSGNHPTGPPKNTSILPFLTPCFGCPQLAQTYPFMVKIWLMDVSTHHCTGISRAVINVLYSTFLTFLGQCKGFVPAKCAVWIVLHIKENCS